MRILLVTASPTMQWIIGRTLNEAGITREKSEHQLSVCRTMEQAAAQQNGLQPRPDLMLFAADTPVHDGPEIRSLCQICDECRVWIVYDGPADVVEKNLSNCPAPLISISDFNAEFVRDNFVSRELAFSR